MKYPASRRGWSSGPWICGLLLLRLSLVIPALHASELYAWAVYPTLSHLITLYLLYLNRRDLATYRIDRLCYLIVQFAGPFQVVFCPRCRRSFPRPWLRPWRSPCSPTETSC